MTKYIHLEDAAICLGFRVFLRRCSIFSTSACVFEGFAGDTESLITSGRFFQLGV